MLMFRVVETDGTMTQEQLLRFVQKEGRRRLLSCPPFNIRHMLGTAVVCALFPGIVMGQRRAIGITVALLATLLATWLWDAPVWTERLLIFWGIWSGVIWVVWQFILFLMGLGAWQNTRHRQNPAAEEKEGVTAPWELVLHWKAETDTRYTAGTVLHAPKEGFYLLELKLKDTAAGDRLTWEGCTACYTERETLPGVSDTHHALFRLKPGNHPIVLVLETDTPPVKSTLSQLNHV